MVCSVPTCPIDADLSCNRFEWPQLYAKHSPEFESVYSFYCHYLPDNYPDDKGPAIDAFSNLAYNNLTTNSRSVCNWLRPLRAHEFHR